MSDNWVVQNLENALETWNEKLAEIWQLITQSPEQFKGGTIWNVIVGIHGAVQAIGLALLVLFFVVGVMKTCGSFAELKRPEHALKVFIRFVLAKAAVTYGLELMIALFNIVQGLISTIMNAAGFGKFGSIFLQNFRSTLIPAIAVPVSLIGTFFFMDMLGFSINMLTLFALVLAIGIVVDNAIVVVEAVHVKMEREKLSPYKASVEAMKEIGGAIVAITLVMSAVFVPVGFMSGTVGIFYQQFSLTLAVAIVISGINALTLSETRSGKKQTPQFVETFLYCLQSRIRTF